MYNQQGYPQQLQQPLPSAIPHQRYSISGTHSPIMGPQQTPSYPSSIPTPHRQSISPDMQNQLMSQLIQEGGFINPTVEMATALNTVKNGMSPLARGLSIGGGGIPQFQLSESAVGSYDDVVMDTYSVAAQSAEPGFDAGSGARSPRTTGSRRASATGSPLLNPADLPFPHQSEAYQTNHSRRSSLNVPIPQAVYDQAIQAAAAVVQNASTASLYGTSPGSERFGTHQSRRGSVASALGAGLSMGRPASLGALAAAEVARDVKALRETLSQKRVDEKVIIEILGFSTPEQAAQLAQAYKANFGHTLAEVLDKELSGNFKKMCVAMANSLADNDAMDLHDALSGLGTNEDILIEILVGRSNAEIRAIAAAYKTRYGKELETVLSSELSHHVKRLFIVLIQAQRDETQQILSIEEDVESLFQAGKSKSHKDVYTFISILCNRSTPHLLQVFETYHRKHGVTVEELIRKDFKGDLEKSLMALVHSIQNRPAHVAQLFQSALNTGHIFNKVDDSKLIRLTVRHRHPRVMALVREAFQAVFGQSLYRKVEEVTSGEFKRLMLTCIGLDGA
ncbi:hypothetical protein HK097_000852 [Rhizophlyctis rosea]|uniref:Annexin n=1 Tax=Rhizophlyctis rosea TaxID=64517 RepID=A0AAD5S6U6_9FUNG|nr:hypothetical protein HK097_000852 [Rhizophlyctis rosea]